MLETKSVIFSAALFVALVLLILALWQMWRTAKNMAAALEEINKTLPEILANMQEITANVHSATDMIKHEAEAFVLLSMKMRAFLGLVNDVEMTLLEGFRAPLVEKLRTARGLLKGIKVFLDVLLQKDDARYGGGRL